MNTQTASREVLERVSTASWKALAGARVWFGHQSVGSNIMQGLADLIAGGSVPLSPPLRTRAGLKPGLAHDLNGENGRPDVKIRAFASWVDDEVRGEVDLAGFKFCYVDIRPDMDGSALFAAYQREMAALAARHPSVRFFHVTCPVTVVEESWQATIKRALGRTDRAIAANAAREAFNQRLRDAYAGEIIFDLAAVESTLPDGSRRQVTADGRACAALVPEYTTDGRHLDTGGAKWVAAHLLAFLAGAAGRAGRWSVG